MAVQPCCRMSYSFCSASDKTEMIFVLEIGNNAPANAINLFFNTQGTFAMRWTAREKSMSVIVLCMLLNIIAKKASEDNSKATQPQLTGGAEEGT